MRAARRERIGRAVGGVKEWRKEGESAEGTPQRSAHDAIRSATETVKIPHSSMRCSNFLNPAAATN